MAITFKFTKPGVKGAVYAIQEEKSITQIINELEQPTAPLTLGSFLQSGFQYQELKPKTVQEKAAQFCLIYKKHKGVAYRASKTDKANLAHVTISEPLLNTYFTNYAYPLTGTKCMSDYVRHFNVIRDLSTNGTPVKKRFPDVYDREYEKTISQDSGKLQDYWAHLRTLGFVKTDMGWTKQLPLI